MALARSATLSASLAWVAMEVSKSVCSGIEPIFRIEMVKLQW